MASRGLLDPLTTDNLYHEGLDGHALVSAILSGQSRPIRTNNPVIAQYCRVPIHVPGAVNLDFGLAPVGQACYAAARGKSMRRTPKQPVRERQFSDQKHRSAKEIHALLEVKQPL
jgi:hypothetical protein